MLHSVLRMPRSLFLTQVKSIAGRSTGTACTRREGMIVRSADNNNNNTEDCLQSGSLGSRNASSFPPPDAGRTGRESFYWNSLLRELYKRPSSSSAEHSWKKQYPALVAVVSLAHVSALLFSSSFPFLRGQLHFYPQSRVRARYVPRTLY